MKQSDRHFALALTFAIIYSVLYFGSSSIESFLLFQGFRIFQADFQFAVHLIILMILITSFQLFWISFYFSLKDDKNEKESDIEEIKKDLVS
jgi:hypothetical protein